MAGLRDFLRRHTSFRDCLAELSLRVGNREANFLSAVRHGVLANPRNPCARLLRHAGISLGDIERNVAAKGIERTLTDLMEAGVYLSLDEFKGHRPLERFGRVIEFTKADVLNPRAGRAFGVDTGGSQSKPSRLPMGLDHLDEAGINLGLCLHVNGTDHGPLIVWFPLPPVPSGLLNSLRYATMDLAPRHWFAQTRRTTPLQWLMTYGTLFLGRMFGRPLPAPELVPMENAGRVVRAAARLAARHGRCTVNTYVSSALRTARAAASAGISLDKVTFITSSEPLTLERRRAIEASGASVSQIYWISEVGIVAAGCPWCTSAADEMHLWTDSIAAVTGCPTRPGGRDGLAYFTPLLGSCPTAVINLEMGDMVSFSERDCACELGKAGLKTMVSDVRSVRRITAEGMTISERELVELVDRVLPERFGGDPGHYQVVEHAEKTARITLLVDPALGHIEESAVRHAFIEHLMERHVTMGAVLSQSNTIHVVRRPPYSTAAGKVHPIHVLVEAPDRTDA